MTDVTVNGKAASYDEGATVHDVVTALGGRGDGCAVAVNADVVPRSDWPSRRLEAGDRIEVLTAVQGG